MKTYGNALSGGIYNHTEPDLPRAGGRQAHRPWCVDCKCKHDAEQLNDEGRCARCVTAAASRAEAAQRREQRLVEEKAAQQAREAEERETARRETATTAPVSKPRTPRTRPATPRAERPPRRTRPPRVRAPRPQRTPKPPRPPAPPRGKQVDELAIVTDYLTHGMTRPAIATKYGVRPKRIGTILVRRGVELRDDRAGHSGSEQKVYDADLVDQVADLYAGGLSQGEVAEQLGLTRKIVWRLMLRHDIEARQGETGHMDGSRGLKDLMAALHVDSATVKRWALDNGLLHDATKPGLPSMWLVQAYAAAHPLEEAS